MMSIEPRNEPDAPVVPQDVPQLQLAAAAAEALPRTGGGAGLQQLAWGAQDGGRAPPGKLRYARAERRGVERAADEVAQQ